MLVIHEAESKIRAEIKSIVLLFTDEKHLFVKWRNTLCTS